MWFFLSFRCHFLFHSYRIACKAWYRRNSCFIDRFLVSITRTRTMNIHQQCATSNLLDCNFIWLSNVVHDWLHSTDRWMDISAFSSMVLKQLKVQTRELKPLHGRSIHLFCFTVVSKPNKIWSRALTLNQIFLRYQD